MRESKGQLVQEVPGNEAKMLNFEDDYYVYDILRKMSLRENEYCSIGENPPGEVPGMARIDDSSSPVGLERKANEFKHNFPEIIAHAKKKGKDIVASTSSHGTIAIIGVGIITAVAGGIIIYEHKKHSKKKEI